jgi:myosin-crossreactive antigen
MVVDSRFDILSILSDFLETARDTRSVRTALEAIYVVLLNDQGGTRYTSILEEVGGLTNIENLQEDESEEIYQACVRILENFFHCDEQQSSVEQKENIIFDFGARTSSLSG